MIDVVVEKKIGNGAQWKENEIQLSEKDIQHDIEEVYTTIGFGKIHWVLVLVCGLYVQVVLNETLGMGIISMASQCEFETNAVDQALLGSASSWGVFISSYFTGCLSDMVGRRTVLIYTTLAANLMTFISMFLPNFWSFVVFRFLAGFFISGAASSCYSYLGEMFSAYYRPIVINCACTFLGISVIFCPAVSWPILSMDWSLYISEEFSFRPWRLILLCYFLPGFIATIILIFLSESPKYLLSKGRFDDAYKAVDWICRHSKGESLADLKIYKLKPETSIKTEDLVMIKSSNILVKMCKETVPLFKRPHALNISICSVIMMSIFATCSGMGFWFPTIQNRVELSGPSDDSSPICSILNTFGTKVELNTTMDHCDDTITQKSLEDSLIIGAVYVLGYGILGLIIKPIGCRNLSIGTSGISGVFGIVLIWITGEVAIVICFIIFLVLPGLGISVLNYIVVELVPTNLRSKAVCIVMMLGRSGAIIGTYIIGALLEKDCVLTFSLIGGFNLICAALVFLLPIKDK